MSGTSTKPVQTFSLNDEPVGHDHLGRDNQLLSVVDQIVHGKPPLVIGVQGDWGRA